MADRSARNGILLAFLGGMLLTVDIPLIRLSQSSLFMAMAIRGGCLALVFTGLHVALWRKMNWPCNPFADLEWVMIGAVFALTNVFFIGAVYFTTTANLVFILAFNPMLAALLSWFVLGERPSMATWLTIFATIIGVFIIVGDGLANGTGFGDFLSLCCAMAIAVSITMIRRSGKDMALAPGFSGLLTFAFALPMAFLEPWPVVPEWLLFNSLLLTPLAAFCLVVAPRLIPGPQVALFYLLETVLAPIWVWIIFEEVPTERTFIGGTIVILAILLHSVWQVRRSSRSLHLPNN